MSKIITVDFRQDTLFAVERDYGVFVALKPICDSLGLIGASSEQVCGTSFDWLTGQLEDRHEAIRELVSTDSFGRGG